MPGTAGIISALAAVGGLAYSASQRPDQPDPLNYGQLTRDTLQAQIDLAPQKYASEAQFGPQYDALNAQRLRNQLLGQPAHTEQQLYYDTVTQPGPVTGTYQADSRPGQVGADGKPFKKGDLIYGPSTTVQVPKYRDVDVPAQGGYLDLIQNDVAPRASAIQAQENTASRTADIADVKNLGPEAIAAMKAANPEQAALLDKLTSGAQSDLDLGQQMDPYMQRNLQQSLRAGQAARGFGYGGNDAYAEATAQAQMGYGLQQQRRQYAQGIVGLNQSVYGDPYQQILGRTSGANAAASAYAGQAGGQLSGSLFNPESSMSQDIYGANYNAANAANIAGLNRTGALAGSALGASGNILGGYLRGSSGTGTGVGSTTTLNTLGPGY